MSKEGVSFKNRDRFIQLGIAISTLRKLRGMSQDQLAEKANMSRSHLSAIEAPNMIRSFSLETLFNLADALMITPSDLLNTSLFSEQINELTGILRVLLLSNSRHRRLRLPPGCCDPHRLCRWSTARRSGG